MTDVSQTLAAVDDAVDTFYEKSTSLVHILAEWCHGIIFVLCLVAFTVGIGWLFNSLWAALLLGPVAFILGWALSNVLAIKFWSVRCEKKLASLARTLGDDRQVWHICISERMDGSREALRNALRLFRAASREESLSQELRDDLMCAHWYTAREYLTDNTNLEMVCLDSAGWGDVKQLWSRIQDRNITPSGPPPLRCTVLEEREKAEQRDPLSPTSPEEGVTIGGAGKPQTMPSVWERDKPTKARVKVDSTRWLGIVAVVVGLLICTWQIHELRTGESFTFWMVGVIPVPVIVLGFVFVAGGILLLITGKRSS